MPFPLSQDVIISCASFSSVEGWSLLLPGSPGDRIADWVTISVPVHSSPWLHPPSYALDYVPFPGKGEGRGYSGRLVALTIHPHLAAKLKKESALRLFPLWYFVACYRRLIRCINVVMWEYCVLISILLDETQFSTLDHSLCCILQVGIYFALKFVMNFHVGLRKLNECHL